MSVERDEKQKEVLAGGNPESAASDIDGPKRQKGMVRCRQKSPVRMQKQTA